MARPRVAEETRVISVRVPLWVYERLVVAADAKGLPVGGFVRRQLTRAVERD